MLRQMVASRPGRASWGGGVVCGKGVADSFGHGGTTSVTVGSLIASRNCDAGRRRSVSASAGRNPRDGRSTPRRNVGGAPIRAGRAEAGPPPRPSLPGLRILGRARGHAATGTQRFSVIGPGVTSPRATRAMRATAAGRARRPCGRRRTVNASGYGATATRADSNAAWSTKTRGPNAAKAMRWRSAPPPIRRGPDSRKVRS